MTGRKTMLYTERAELILQQLKLQSTVKVGELSSMLSVSVDTVRRDLKAMEQSGLIRCVRGGACLPESMASFLNFTGREIVNSDLKRQACRKALEFIKNGDVIALNSGTTNTILSQELINLDKNITVVTNNYAAIDVLMQSPSIKLIAIGGNIDMLERSSYGTVCENEFGKYYPDIAFLSVNAVNYNDAFTDFRYDEIGVMQLLARTSKKVIAVMDSSKLGKCSKKRALEKDEVDLLITDNNVSDEICEKYKENGILIL